MSAIDKENNNKIDKIAKHSIQTFFFYKIKMIHHGVTEAQRGESIYLNREIPVQIKRLACVTISLRDVNAVKKR